VRVRAERAAGTVRRALGLGDDRRRAFDTLADAVGRLWRHDWIGLVGWHENGLGGSVEHARGEHAVQTPALTGWLVREAESGADVIVAPGAELGVEGIAAAFPLRRENSALVGFLVVAAPKLPRRHVELALLDSLDEIGLTLAERPALDGGGGQDSEPLEALTDSPDLALARGDER